LTCANSDSKPGLRGTAKNLLALDELGDGISRQVERSPHESMNNTPIDRRCFLQRVAVTLAAVSISNRGVAASPDAQAPWTIGCLNRPWVKWSLDEMLDGAKVAGYRTIGLQTPTPADPFVGSNASAEYLAMLKQKIAARGLTAIQGRLRTLDAASFADATTDIRRQIDNARKVGLAALINTGTNKPELYENWYRLMAFAAEYGADKGVQLVTKPHGGVVGTAADILTCLEKIKHPNLGIWYDAGNMLYYTGKDPLAELEPIISRVTAFTAKDCAGKGSEVMIQFGQGKVDFAGIFRRLQKARFKGPIMVESCAIGATAAETTANAKANREFLQKTIAALG
jgi:sugar phosphate isomerase/epimerase